ncbi:hypothetical protein TWF679_003490 [Orbilia oligospora]|uniref:Uncharacterized protein n=1 Tax=Orbilia oligospora TaxID=2813651 RepID=A0A8H8URG2_ORBOL|nr:hypothetical protein TWF679_003490 [Orbilia oligospora]
MMSECRMVVPNFPFKTEASQMRPADGAARLPEPRAAPRHRTLKVPGIRCSLLTVLAVTPDIGTPPIVTKLLAGLEKSGFNNRCFLKLA